MLFVLLISFVSGVVGTCFGAGLSAFFSKNSDKSIGFLFALTGGIMLSIVCFDLIPEGLEITTPVFIVLGVLLGLFLVVALQQFTEKIYFKMDRKGESQHSEYRTMSMILLLAVMLHNFPEGLVIGSEYVHNEGFLMAIVIGLHNIPEGIAMALPMRLSGIKWWRIIFNCFISGLPTVFGALIGFAIASISSVLVGLCMAIAGGAMIYITFAEVLPRGNTILGNEKSSIVAVIGCLIGLMLILLVH